MGSNPSDAEFDHRFSFVDVSRRNDIKELRGDCKQEEIRINLLRLVEPSTRNIVRILIVLLIEKYRS